MVEHQEISWQEHVEQLTNILREKYPIIYQDILGGSEPALLKSIASRLKIPAKDLISEIVSRETNRILKFAETSQKELERLKDMVDHMQYSP